MDATLLEEYRRTRYIIETPSSELVLRIGEMSVGVDNLLTSCGASSGAFITASNPGSRMLTAQENKERHEALVADVQSRGYKFLLGRGIGEDPKWTAERSLFIIGIGSSEAEDLGDRFGQLAIITKRVGEPVQLCHAKLDS